ncbi:MAG: 50S ribosomal protein L22 [Chloroflexota bacterium]|nr:50S ribosomal protein L22 [Chloroflexota bacterium]
MAVRSVLKNVGMSTKRVRPLVDAVRGKPVQAAIDALRFHPGPAAEQVNKALRSAAANAENNEGMNLARLRVVAAAADPGPVIKRWRAKARGRVSRIKRRSCHITIVVDEAEA